MNNKKLGSDFERSVLNDLNAKGYWVHFMAPDERGMQPFDIIAVKDGTALAIECKTVADNRKYFSINRLEANQRTAFDKWLKCGNAMPIIAVGHLNKISYIPYSEVRNAGKVEI